MKRSKCRSSFKTFTFLNQRGIKCKDYISAWWKYVLSWSHESRSLMQIMYTKTIWDGRDYLCNDRRFTLFGKKRVSIKICFRIMWFCCWWFWWMLQCFITRHSWRRSRGLSPFLGEFSLRGWRGKKQTKTYKLWSNISSTTASINSD